ncbi:hypothetical protein RUM44_013710 [Polyplax serrata]|uniref:Uncharacterized protein n=1 Tax=Polyplax serrata TaxID=468196 RepID=A0ABR1BIK8_POLSC
MKAIPTYLLLIALACFRTVSGLGGSEEKFIKKYAMMKVYESCFGPQVLREIRKEMREAAQKCSGEQVQPEAVTEKYPNKEPTGNTVKQPPDWYNQDVPFKAKPSVSGVKVKKPIHTADTLLLQQWSEEQKQQQQQQQQHNNAEGSTSEEQDQSETINPSATEPESPLVSSKKPVDISKLEEAILNIGRPMASFGLPKPTATGTKFHQQAPAVGFYPPMYYPPPVPFPPSYPYHPAYFPAFFQSAAPMGGFPSQSIYRNRVRSAKITNFGGRRGKQSDFKSQIESVAFQYNTKIRNISCIMQELGYLDAQLEPNFVRITERVSKLSIDEELKQDMLDGIKFCKQFSQCIPETKRESSQLSRDLLRPMFFFRCYKHKKLESCIMKDIRERVSQTSVELNNEVRRSFNKNSDIVGPIFDSLFGTSGDDFESSLF